MTDTDRLVRLVTTYAKSTLLVATRLNALERAMQDDFASHGLWDKYAAQIGLVQSRANLLQQRREFLADQELSAAIAELQRALKE